MLGPIQSAFAMAAEAEDWFVLGCTLRRSAAVPATIGDVNEVPDVTEYDPNGYVVMIFSPGAATQTT